MIEIEDSAISYISPTLHNVFRPVPSLCNDMTTLLSAKMFSLSYVYYRPNFSHKKQNLACDTCVFMFEHHPW
jgi:hypothetical protein